MRCHRPGRWLLAVLLWLGVSPVGAQVVRLPEVATSGRLPPGHLPGRGHPPSTERFASHADSAAELIEAPGEPDLPDGPERPPDARPGMFQKLIFDGQWLARGGSDGLGLSSMQLSAVLAVPVPSRSYPLIITPGFAVHYFDGPSGWDLPPRVYDAYTQFRWMRRLSPRLGIDLAITPGAFSDFQQGCDDQLRITGHGVAAWTATPALKIVLGAAYVDRMKTDVLPVCGLIWTPHDEVKFELVFPHPRVARRIYTFGAAKGGTAKGAVPLNQGDCPLSHAGTDEVQDWLYLAGEFGGGIWAVERASGSLDMVDYTDFRLVLGIQRKVIGGLDGRLEVGYSFGREIQYASATPDFKPADTVMLRGGLTY